MSDFDIYNEPSGGELADRLPDWLEAIEMTSAPLRGRSLDLADPEVISGLALLAQMASGMVADIFRELQPEWRMMAYYSTTQAARELERSPKEAQNAAQLVVDVWAMATRRQAVPADWPIEVGKVCLQAITAAEQRLRDSSDQANGDQ